MTKQTFLLGAALVAAAVLGVGYMIHKDMGRQNDIALGAANTEQNYLQSAQH